LSSASLDFEPTLEGIRAHIDLLAGQSGAPVTVVIDGPSGSGKTTLAQLLAEAWPERAAVTFHLDDVYPGWEGLAAGSAISAHVLAHRAQGKPAHWQRYDWALGEHAEWNTVDPLRPLIVEGCGSLTEIAAECAQVRLWVEAPDDLRQQRALGRGGEDFEAHWGMWNQQFVDFVAHANPVGFATMTVRATR
jgi:uridine kinase